MLSPHPGAAASRQSRLRSAAREGGRSHRQLAMQRVDAGGIEGGCGSACRRHSSPLLVQADWCRARAECATVLPCPRSLQYAAVDTIERS